MRTVALIILDGWGLGEPQKNNAIHMAHTPFMDYLWKTYPHTRLQASEEYVGLPPGQIGGSEVGHITIGAGRVIYQDLQRITIAFDPARPEEDIEALPTMHDLLQKASSRTTHLIGLVSPGGIHSHRDHLYRLLELMKKRGCLPPVIHCITDGRDTPPRSGRAEIEQLHTYITHTGYGRIATIIGRFYAMDRDTNISRTQRAAQLFLHATADSRAATSDTGTALQEIFGSSYSQDVTDEFIEPHVVDPTYRGIDINDICFFWNFRSDRMKQLVTEMSHILPPSEMYTMTQYDRSFHFPVIFTKHPIKHTLGEIISSAGLTQLRAAETEKFAHVTYFFNGGIEITFPHELRSLSKSNAVKHDAQPEMKAEDITNHVKSLTLQHHPSFILVNFANPDMVGHTGNFTAAVQGVETVDRSLKELCSFLTNRGYTCCITADHGNADIMYDLQTGEPHTAHTLNRVPFIIYTARPNQATEFYLKQDDSFGLAHIAPTILDLMGLPPQREFYPSLLV